MRESEVNCPVCYAGRSLDSLAESAPSVDPATPTYTAQLHAYQAGWLEGTVTTLANRDGVRPWCLCPKHRARRRVRA